jgi:hypothetical protein
MAAALLPLAATVLPGILSGVSGLLGIINEGRKLHGGRLRKMRMIRRHKRRVSHHGKGKMMITRYAHKYPIGHHGRGPVASVLGAIPLLGSFLGPIASAFGGRVRRRQMHKPLHHLRLLHKLLTGTKGRGFSPMYMHREFGRGLGYGMLTPPGGHMLPYAKQLSNALVPSASKILGMGLLAPAGGRIRRRRRGGKLVHRKGYYRHIHGRRVHVAPTTVRIGGAVRRRRVHRRAPRRRIGGYIPYQWRL